MTVLCFAAAVHAAIPCPGARLDPSGRVEEVEMQSENKLFDDFVKMVNGLAGTMAGMGREAESSMREKAREWMAGADFVGRDEFEAVKAMAAAARDENQALSSRIAALEAKLGGSAGAKRSTKPKGSPEA
jgi:BMFP domain-containing protein YqiC